MNSASLLPTRRQFARAGAESYRFRIGLLQPTGQKAYKNSHSKPTGEYFCVQPSLRSTKVPNFAFEVANVSHYGLRLLLSVKHAHSVPDLVMPWRNSARSCAFGLFRDRTKENFRSEIIVNTVCTNTSATTVDVTSRLTERSFGETKEINRSSSNGTQLFKRGLSGTTNRSVRGPTTPGDSYRKPRDIFRGMDAYLVTRTRNMKTREYRGGSSYAR